MKAQIVGSVMAFVFASSVQAGQIIEDFSTTTHRDPSTTGVWNSYFHTATSQIATDPVTFPTDNIDTELSPATDVGDGSDGPFDVSTYSKFSVGGVTPSNTITIDTAAHPVLQLTYFNLAPGWTIQGTGPNPLWFKVLGTFTNSGSINCSGGNGAPTDVVGVSPQGGVGRCGGGTGGNGGFSGGSSTNGLNGCTVPACAMGVGHGGTTQANTAGGGGGGGGHFSVATSGQNGGGTNVGPDGTGGASDPDPSMTEFGSLTGGPGGGAGGGGGGNATTTNPGSGAGGGGGGGFIRISSVGDFVSSGTILATGGAGGNETAGINAGAGGGGGGGSIWIQTAGNFTKTGLIDAGLGLGGTLGGGGTGSGGNGGQGRTWLVLGGNYSSTVVENPVTNILDIGEIHFSETAYSIVSTAYDTRNTKPHYTSFVVNSNMPLGTSTLTLLVAGSSDGFVSDNTGFVPSTNLSALQGKRYFKFKIQMQYIPAVPTNAPIGPPLTVTSVVASFDGTKQTIFPFSPACGYLGDPWEFPMMILIIFLGVFFTTGRLRIRIPRHRTTNQRPV